MPKSIVVKVGSTTVVTPPSASYMKGWEVTTTNVGLAPFGITGSSLPAYTGPTTIPSGARISNVRFTTEIIVAAGDIIIEKCMFQPVTGGLGSDGHIVNGWYPQGDITIQDCEWDGSLCSPAEMEAASAFVGGGNLYRNYIHDVGSGIAQMSSTNTRNFGNIPNTIIIENNYVHQLVHYSVAHHEAATTRDFVMGTGNTRTMIWRGNYFNSDSEFVSGGLFLQPTWEPFYNVTVQDNVLAGEGFNLALMDSVDAKDVSTDGKAYANMRAINNRFVPGTREYYGPANIDGSPQQDGWAVWTDNYMFDDAQPEKIGAAVSAPNVPRPTDTNTGTTGALTTNSTAMTIFSAGATYADIDFTNLTQRVEVRANNVTFKNCRFRNGLSFHSVTGGSAVSCELNGNGLYISSSANITVDLCKVKNWNQDAMHVSTDNGPPVCENINIKNNYIYGSIPVAGQHSDGIQIRGSDGLQFINNYIDFAKTYNADNDNACIYIEDNYSVVPAQLNYNVNIVGNWLKGGGYTCYLSDGTGNFSNNVVSSVTGANGYLYPGVNPAILGIGNIKAEDGSPLVLHP